MSACWVVLGASSAMARAFSRQAAARGHSLILAGRDTLDLARDAADAVARGAASAEVAVWDTRLPETHAALAALAAESSGPLGVAVFAGAMPEQAVMDDDPSLISGLISDSFSGLAETVHRLAPLIEARGGTVLGIGSVAGDRGRLGNYLYGAAKAAFHTYLAGLRNRLGRRGAHVVTVKPGFVDTAMTWGLPGLFLVAAPEDVARACWRAIDKKRNVIYAPWFWMIIMLIIRLVPERIFKRLKI
ncbi:MAG: SDR family NAD(P)-dependent oxidoreductase [Pseudomonadota bacterium]